MISNGEHVARTCSLRNESCFALAINLSSVVRVYFWDDNLIHYKQLPVVMPVIFFTITRTQTPTIIQQHWRLLKDLLLLSVDINQIQSKLRPTTSQPTYGPTLLIIHIMISKFNVNLTESLISRI